MRSTTLVATVLPVFARLARITAGQDANCTLSDLEEFDYMHSPEAGFVIYWAVPAATVSMRVEVDVQAWAGVGFSEDGMMVGSDAVIFLPAVEGESEEGDVGEHILGSQSISDIIPSDYSELSETGYEQEGDSTYFWFSRNTTPEVPDEEKLVIPNVVGTPIFIIWAKGMDNGFGYHGIDNRGWFEVDLFCPSVPLPTPTPSLAPTPTPLSSAPLTPPPTSAPTPSTREIPSQTPTPSEVSANTSAPAMGDTPAPASITEAPLNVTAMPGTMEGTHMPTMSPLMINATPTSASDSMMTHLPTAVTPLVTTTTSPPTMGTTPSPTTPKMEPTLVPSPHSPSFGAMTPSPTAGTREIDLDDSESPTSSPTQEFTGFIAGATRVGGGVHPAATTSVAVAVGLGVLWAWTV